MYALRLVSRRVCLHHSQTTPITISAISASSPSSPLSSPSGSSRLVQHQIRTHVYDKRNYIPEFDDWMCVPTARAYDTNSMKMSQPRLRRLSQYMLWITSLYLSYALFKYFVVRQNINKVEKWDYQAKYWRDGYWIREFPEGIVIKEFNNGSYSLEPGQTPRPPLVARIIRKFFAVGTD